MQQSSSLGRRRSLRSSTALKRIAQDPISVCGHDPVHYDPNSDRDLKCSVCWENREIQVQRLIAPFERAFALVDEELQQKRRASTTETSIGISDRIGPEGSDTARSDAGMIGKPVPEATVDTDQDAKMIPAPLDEFNIPEPPSEPLSRHVDESDCIRVLDISEAKPQAQMQQAPATYGGFSSSHAPAPEKLRRRSTSSNVNSGAGKIDQLQNEKNSTIPRARSVEKTKKQRTLFSFFSPKPPTENGDEDESAKLQRKRTGSTSSATTIRTSSPRNAKARAIEKTHTQTHMPFPELKRNERAAVDKTRRASSSSAAGGARSSPPVPSRRSTRGKASNVTYYEGSDSEVEESLMS